MIFENGNKKTIEKNNETPKVHVKTSSQDLSNSSNHSNIYLTKLINQNKIKNESLINDSLPNLRKNIQNIFANEENKEKAFRYLIQKNKDLNTNSRDTKKAIKTPEIRPYRKIEMQSKRIISPYNNKNIYSFKPIITNYDLTKSCADIREPNYIRKNYINNTIYRYSVNTQKYNSEDEPFNQNDFYKENQFWQNDINIYNKNMNVNRNKGNKFEHISIYNTYNNTFNNYRLKNDKVKKNVTNQTYDYGNLYNLSNTLNKNDKSDKSSIEQNPYKDYMKSSNLSNIKKKILGDNKQNIIIDISDNENNNKNKDIKKNNYVKRVKNERIKVQKNENLMKKNPTKMNDSLINVKLNNNYYVHKNLGHKILYQKKNDKNYFNPNSNAIKIEDNGNNLEENNLNNTTNIDRKENNIINNNKTYEKRKNYYDIYGHKDIRVNTLDNNKKYENENNNDNDKKMSVNVNTIKVNIDKNILKDYCNSPLSNRYNKYFIDNRNKLINKNKNKNTKTYEKRETIQRSPKSNYIIEQFDNYKNKEQISVDAKTETNAINVNNLKKKYIFNDEEEIIEYIKKKYNKRNIEEIINRGNTNNNNVIYEPKKGNKYVGLMTTEEGKKIKQKNEELSTEIKNLKFENRQYKKELNDMKNKFIDLSKEINIIKENK